MIYKFRVGQVPSPEIARFLELGETIYPQAERTQASGDLRKILENSHPLSYQWEAFAYLHYEGGERAHHERNTQNSCEPSKLANARLLLTLYPGDSTAYIGFLEARERTALENLIQQAEEDAKALGKINILAPINASFWLGYRHRSPNGRRLPITGEPWQKAEYRTVYDKLGYGVQERYYSYAFEDSLYTGPADPKPQRRYEGALAKGYTFCNPKRESFSQVLGEIYDLLMPLYADFPVYKPLTKEAFFTQFSVMESILDYSMIDLAYYQGELVAFLLSFPDYGNLLTRDIRWWKIPKLLLIRRRAKRYIQMYMGVAKGHEGLGLALSFLQYEKVRQRKAYAEAALVHEGKATGVYGRMYTDYTTEYLLFGKDLKG